MLLRSLLVAAASLAMFGHASAQTITPPIQMLVPGFEVVELPLRLPNLNNLRYRADGKLYALGYDGNVWLLRDTDGDGLEDSSTVYFENKGSLRGPIGMAVVPDGHALLHRDGALDPDARGVIVAAKGKVSALLDFDGDDVAEIERVIASGWEEIPQNVDTVGIAVHPTDGSIYFGLGTAAFFNAYLLDEQGKSAFDLASDRGTIQRIKPDLSGRETICTGVRFTIGLQFDAHGELFATDQEGATWLPNGNPFDELLLIRPGRHYGFPPRHPHHLPRVFDEPSVFDYRPQHQSTCGLVFNLAQHPVKKTFGPESWVGDALVVGESRGKLYRTKLVRTDSGEYVAANQILACISMLAVDCALTPSGELLLCCHSGGPDWGTGPSGEGKLFLIRQRKSDAPRPVAVWSSGSHEVRVAFDRPLDTTSLKGLAANVEIMSGPFVAAGDRFEVLLPGYDVVQRQQSAPKQKADVYSASVTADRRTLVLATAPQLEAVHYAIRLPGLGRQLETPSPGTLPQESDIDVDYSLAGVSAEWSPDGAAADGQAAAAADNATVIVPHLDFAISRALREGVPEFETFAERLSHPGTLTLTTRLDTLGLFLPVTQPGSQLDYAPEQDQWITARLLRLRGSREIRVRFRDRTYHSSLVAGEHVLDIDVAELAGELPMLEITLATGSGSLDLHAEWLARLADGTERSGPLPIHRLLVPWAQRESPSAGVVERREIPELAGANWGRGRQVFHGKDAACHLCHVAHGEGRAIGPDLSNLIHRDYASVARDIRHPSFAINPDYITYTVQTKAGQVLTGVLRSEGQALLISDANGQSTKLPLEEVEETRPAATSVMPEGILDKLSDTQFRDLMAYLLLPPPRMPRDAPEPGPPPRGREEVAAVLAGSQDVAAPPKPLRLLLVAGPKDHGPGEHDYPAWLDAWSQLLAAADGVTVDTAMEWPTAEQIRLADTIVLYQRGSWNEERAAAIDAHLAKGGGLVLIHWAVEAGSEAADFSRRIGLASDISRTQYRHGPLEVDWTAAEIQHRNHPISRNISKIALHDESYWNLVGGTQRTLLAIGGPEAGEIRPELFWTVESARGRVFVSIPGHYSWTFDDPIYRIVLLRGIAWTSQESVDRFNPLVSLGVDFAASAE